MINTTKTICMYVRQLRISPAPSPRPEQFENTYAHCMPANLLDTMQRATASWSSQIQVNGYTVTTTDTQKMAERKQHGDGVPTHLLGLALEEAERRPHLE